MLGQRQRQWATIVTTLAKCFVFAGKTLANTDGIGLVTNTIHYTNVGLILTHVIRRWPSIKTTLHNCLMPAGINNVCITCLGSDLTAGQITIPVITLSSAHFTVYYRMRCFWQWLTLAARGSTLDVKIWRLLIMASVWDINPTFYLYPSLGYATRASATRYLGYV